ncbi:MAG: long-chain fatty acid--CoA ligase [Actinomycetota bacterium]|nr:long-chain fatty acid--CoA ligase [Actinomycetota bacterium]MDH5313521.1 long-chain fatty acid--CoA ligase [Actinomycetota bacterium]
MTEHRPWFDAYPPDMPHSLAPFPKESVFELLRSAAAGFPDKPALAFFGAHMTYAELLREVERFSAVLAGLGVRQGDRVGMILPNCPEYVITFFACQRIGAVAVGNNPLYTERELEHQISDSGAKVMIVLDQIYHRFGKIRDAAGVQEVIAVKLNRYMKAPIRWLAPLKFKADARKAGTPLPFIPADHSVRWWADLMRSAGPAPPEATIADPAREVAALVYTGGTTGLSKGAMLSHLNLVANARQAAAWLDVVRQGEDGIVAALPFFHSFGTLVMDFSMTKAAKLILLPRFEIDMALKAMSKEKPSLFPGVPRMYIALNQDPRTPKHDLASLKACISGAAPLPMAVAKRFEEITGGAKVVEGYGLSECSPVTHANPLVGERKEGSIGMPLPDTDVKLVDLDEPDREVAQGERGEMCIKGPQVMLGYWNRPDESGLVIRDGWLHTGDVAIMDEQGYFRIVDRIKDMILVSGFNVYPTEVEAVLFHHPKILKCAVVAVPDDTTGERVKAFIVLKPGETATAEEIVAWCRDPDQGLTGYRVPKEIEFRDELPETLIGKVLRRVLQDEERKKREATGAP